MVESAEKPKAVKGVRAERIKREELGIEARRKHEGLDAELH
ncbi:hypothetical protein QF035_004930 [Streptomyces umbrinus]|uniref:Uncharacterized protein n=1 Tax=Streptomyces umbrinus TaxID=67370 RepID=A0ABU0SUX4_9ACTN|nr:hypothetical protein [Streptomyces umbrinus]MDQ1027348.1 hypothetical protein [Streptomyces umbrinus]